MILIHTHLHKHAHENAPVAINKYVSPYCQAEMYAGLVACSPLVSHGEYSDGTDRQMDRRTDANVISVLYRTVFVYTLITLSK